MAGLTVVMSDFHAGAAESLLTVLDDANRPVADAISPTTTAFATAFGAFMDALGPQEKPELVLLGDMLDLSLAAPWDACAILKGFFAETGLAARFGTTGFLAGNHDHILWSSERFGATTGAAAGPWDAAFWAHATGAFVAADAVGRSRILDSVLTAAGLPGAASWYPNRGLGPVTPAGGGPRRSVILHHGHFVETAYTAMTSMMEALGGKVPRPMTAAAMEAMNGAWIDFGWSTLGDAARLGTWAARDEALLLTGGGAHVFQDRVAAAITRAVVQAAGVAPDGTAAIWAQRFARAAVDAGMGAYADLERYDYDTTLSPDSVATLGRYLSGPVLAQMTCELGADAAADRVTFVFGHTHKPFADRIVAEGFVRPVILYNTGGWVLDTALLSTVEGGGILFIDDDMNAAMLQLWRLSPDETVQPACIVTADPGDNPVARALQRALDASAGGWAAFRTTVAAELARKQAYYMAVTDRALGPVAGRGHG